MICIPRTDAESRLTCLGFEQIAAILLPGGPAPYVLSEELVPPELRLAGCWGCTGPEYDAVLADTLKTAGRWRGRAPAIFVATESIADSSHKLAADPDRECLGVLIHELAHTAEESPETENLTAASEVVARVGLVRSQARRNIEPRMRVVRNDHSATWVRIACHLWYRAWQAGFCCDFTSVIGSYSDFIGSPTSYLTRIGDELDYLQNVPIRLIADYPAHPRFVDLCNAFDLPPAAAAA